jgi:kynurenine formamidase
MSRAIPSGEEVISWHETLSNWGRWGGDDQLGTANLITPAKRVQAAGLVTEGIAVSCAHPIAYEYAPDETEPPRHFLFFVGDYDHVAQKKWGWSASTDTLLVGMHGYTITHLDSLNHMFWHGKMYNDKPASLVGVGKGVAPGAIAALGDGVRTRGVLLDVAGQKGVDWLEPGTPIFPKDLEVCEAATGMRVESGDAILVRHGHFGWRAKYGTPPPPYKHTGLHAACLPWLKERGVAVVGCDASIDVNPSCYSYFGLPVHVVGIVAMGLWLIDNCNLDTLVETCARLNRWTFQLSMAALKLQDGTGCSVNPIAMF